MGRERGECRDADPNPWTPDPFKVVVRALGRQLFVIASRLRSTSRRRWWPTPPPRSRHDHASPDGDGRRWSTTPPHRRAARLANLLSQSLCGESVRRRQVPEGDDIPADLHRRRRWFTIAGSYQDRVLGVSRLEQAT
jgi:hypothetical protein